MSKHVVKTDDSCHKKTPSLNSLLSFPGNGKAKAHCITATVYGFVQVIVFADRVEVWNPGELPHGLTPDMLRKPHGPIPRNPLIAEPLFRVKYVEKAGTGKGVHYRLMKGAPKGQKE